MGEMIDVAALQGEGTFRAYRADPAAKPTAAIIVIQEVFGVNPGIRQKCDRLAEQGYLAIAPDLFWRIAPGVELNPDVPEELQKGLDGSSSTSSQ